MKRANERALARRSKMGGLTLPELLATIAVAAIVLGIAVPSFRELFVQNRLTTQINHLVLDLNFARSEAVSRGGPLVVLCKSPNGNTCSTEASDFWETGWIVFVDKDDDDEADPDEILRIRLPLPAGFTLRASGNFADAVTYRSTGVSAATGQFTLCAENDLTRSRTVIINALGRIYQGQDTDNNRIPEYENGMGIITCNP